MNTKIYRAILISVILTVTLSLPICAMHIVSHESKETQDINKNDDIDNATWVRILREKVKDDVKLLENIIAKSSPRYHVLLLLQQN